MSKLLFCVEISEVVISVSFINFGPDYCVAGLLTVKVILVKSCGELNESFLLYNLCQST